MTIPETVCQHGIRWPWACHECDAVALAGRDAAIVKDDSLDKVCHDMLHTLIEIRGVGKTISAGAASKLDASIDSLASRWHDVRFAKKKTPIPVVAWQRLHPVNGWISVDADDIRHYLSTGQPIRALGVIQE